MDKYEEKIKKYIKENNVRAGHIVFSESVHTVEEAAKATNAKPSDFVKNICLINKEGDKIIVAIVPGDERADIKQIAKTAGVSKLRMMDQDEVLNKLGYPIGGVPSFGCPAEYFIHSKVIEKEVVYSGGGSAQALIKISPKEIIRVTNAKLINSEEDNI